MTEAATFAEIEAIATLAEPVRRDLYRYVAGRGDGVTRDEAAAALGVTRALAAFHLDKLTESGLLRATYRRRPGRSGPGAGRPAKVYWRSERQLDVTLPRRRHEFLAGLLADALARASSSSAPPRPHAGGGPLTEAAREAGVRAGAEARRAAGRRPGRRRLRDTLDGVLARHGYEPQRSEDGDVTLRNCPFHPVSGRFPEVVCTANLALIAGILDGLRTRGVEAALALQEGRCCVVLRVSGG